MKYIMRIGLGKAVSIIFGSYLYFNKRSVQSGAAHAESFVVGMAAGYAPFVSINQQGEYEGFDIEMAEHVAQQMSKKLVLKDLGSMTSLMIALEQGSIDAIMWGISITQQRLQKFAMIHYQGSVTESYPLIFWKTIPAGIQRIDDMHGLTVCVEPTSSQSALLEKYSNIVTVPVEKVDDALLNIQYGKADAALLDPAIAKKFTNKFPEIKTLMIPLAPEDQVQGVGIVIKKENKKLTDQVQSAVNVLMANGTVTRLEKKWDLE